MSAFLFWLFSLLLLVFGAAVVLNRNPIASALSLVISFIALAALFMTLDAFFIGIIQVLVYAGAVMVLFLFIIMLLDLRAEQLRKINYVAIAGGSAVAIVFFLQIYFVVRQLNAAQQPFPALAAKTDDVHNIGALLFTNFNLPFQIIGVLVLVATIVLLTKSRPGLSSFISVVAVLASFAMSCVVFATPNIQPIELTWIDLKPTFYVPFGFVLDDLAKTMLLLVTGVGAVIHVYSLGYMRDDPGKSRYFASLSFFMFSMLG